LKFCGIGNVPGGCKGKEGTGTGEGIGTVVVEPLKVTEGVEEVVVESIGGFEPIGGIGPTVSGVEPVEVGGCGPDILGAVGNSK